MQYLCREEKQNDRGWSRVPQDCGSVWKEKQAKSSKHWQQKPTISDP